MVNDQDDYGVLAGSWSGNYQVFLLLLRTLLLTLLPIFPLLHRL